MRALSSIGLLLLALNAHAAQTNFKFQLAGGEVGINSYSEDPDGSFRSTSKIRLGDTPVDSEVTGKWENGKIQLITMKQTAAGKTATIAFDHGHWHIDAPGQKPIDIDSAYKDGAFFSTFHPQIWKSVLPFPTEGKKFKVALLDNAAIVDVAFAMHSPKKVGSENLTDFTLELTGIPIEVVAKQDGSIAGFNVTVQKFQGYALGYESVFADPIAKFPELSQSDQDTQKVTGMKVPMRDGVVLVADMVRPKNPGKYPTILSRDAYGRKNELLMGEWWAKRGYIFFAEDIRGRGESGGEWDPFVNERKDGYDTVQWIAKQSWSSGKVGMIGGSYGGLVQWSAAIEMPPALKCIIPQVSPPPPMYNIPYENGAFFLFPSVWWTNIVRDKDADMAGIKATPDPMKLLTLPLPKVEDAVLGRDIPFFDRWFDRDRPSKWVGATTLPEIAKVKIPVLHISGTWDGDGVGTKMHWTALRNAGKKNQWLVFGPWEHGFNAKQKHADVDYGPQSLIDLDSVYLRFFDTYLKGKSVKWEATPHVKVFLTGANKWVSQSDWPAPAWHSEKLLLSAPKPANGYEGAGVLGAASGSKPSVYVYDPNAVHVTKADLSPEEASTKMAPKSVTDSQLLFRTAPMTTDTVVAGPIEATLYISTTAKDATFHALILDQAPDGTLRNICMPGTTRATYADETGIPKKVVPGQIYKVVVRPWWEAHQFAKGHRLVLEVTSDLFPIFARNPGTGEPDKTATKLVKAKHTLYHDAKHPSSLKFEVIPAGG